MYNTTIASDEIWEPTRRTGQSKLLYRCENRSMRCLPPPQKIIISVIAPSWIEIVCMSYEVIIFVRLLDFLNNLKYSCVLYLHNFINKSGLPSRNWVHPCFIFINFHNGTYFLRLLYLDVCHRVRTIKGVHMQIFCANV